ncbi:hypothetical protein OO013_04245 [Mangrovivirga sp. M17]|uniref:DoxX-like protein n=1 Tax=Mangrovivirga halotolerans TaxID=2993936 RepID=A0ABT3RMM0_9BACT|nr:hypothetical protein [Mangrovivirga halotolerans]MCX2743060.1 hypothetical protein [Mangrovivirga halotolerans]
MAYKKIILSVLWLILGSMYIIQVLTIVFKDPHTKNLIEFPEYVIFTKTLCGITALIFAYLILSGSKYVLKYLIVILILVLLSLGYDFYSYGYVMLVLSGENFILLTLLIISIISLKNTYRVS